MPGTAAATISIDVPAIDIRTIEISVIGDSPLIVHRWSEKAKAMIAAKQQKRAATAKEARDPQADFEQSLYRMPDSEAYAIPAVAFKGAMVAACRYASMKMTEARGAFHVIGEMVPIIGPAPTMREDMVRVGMGVADIRYRGQFDPWAVNLSIAYNSAVVSPAQLVNLLNLAGFGVGVGEWRPEKDGSFGRFRVESAPTE